MTQIAQWLADDLQGRRRVDTDEFRDFHGTTIETLWGVQPAFAKDGSVTAGGNSLGINDGAAALR